MSDSDRGSVSTRSPVERWFFGGWDLPGDLCREPDLARRAYATGVPMGADLPAPDRRGGPTFVASALADPGVEGHPGGPLERLQVTKVTSDDQGRAIQRVVDIAGSRGAASVDPRTCTPRGPGAAALCARWTDPDFDPDEPAYYARVVETPSCRAYARACLNLSGEDRPSACDDADVPRTARERAWSSPMWFAPARGALQSADSR